MTTALAALGELQDRYASCAVEPPSPQEPEALWVGVLLGIAGVRLLVAVTDLEAIIETPVVTRVPGTRPWVLGIAAHQGGLLPLFCGDELFERRVQGGRIREYCMVIKQPGYRFGITLSKVERTLKLPLRARVDDCPAEDEFAACCSGGFHHEDQFLGILDIGKLVIDRSLSDVAADAGQPSEDRQ